MELKLLIGPLLLIALIVGAVIARRAGLTRFEVAIIVAVGIIFVLIATYTTLMWGWTHFG